MNRDAGSHAFARIEVALRDFQEGGDAAKSPPAIITRNTEEEGIALEGGRIRSAPVPASGAKIHYLRADSGGAEAGRGAGGGVGKADGSPSTKSYSISCGIRGSGQQSQNAIGAPYLTPVVLNQLVSRSTSTLTPSFDTPRVDFIFEFSRPVATPVNAKVGIAFVELTQSFLRRAFADRVK